MIYYLSGKVLLKQVNFIVVECGGVGYQVFVKEGLLNKLKTGEKIFIFVYDIIRENIRDLYGFETLLERNIYEKLLSVSGIGPRTAMSILNFCKVQDLLQAVYEENPAILKDVSGIGSKTASRIVLELKNKIDKTMLDQISFGGSRQTTLRLEVVEALVSLGYSKEKAREAVFSIKEDINDHSILLKNALKKLSL